MRKTALILAAAIAAGAFDNLSGQQTESLSNQECQIVTIAAATATGDLHTLEKELHAGLDAGLTVNRIKEVLVQMYASCGFPRSLQALGTFMKVTEDRTRRGITDNTGPDAAQVAVEEDRYALGKANLQLLTGVVENSPSGINAFAPAIDRFLKEHLFADIFERDILTFKERELATVSALAAMEGVDPMLESHLKMARNTGWTDGQLTHAVARARRIGSDYRCGIFPAGSPGSAEWFTGEVYVEGLVDPAEMENLYSVGQVTFMPGARTNWHTHPAGQTLLVLEGEGWYCERGEPARRLIRGSVVAIPKDTEHWHGASAGTKLVHIAVSNIAGGGNVTWLEPVSDIDYAPAHPHNEAE